MAWGWYDKQVPFNSLVEKTITKIEGGQGDDEITFHTSDGKTFKMYHDQDCCESVSLYDVAGDLEDLIGVPVLSAEESTNSKDHPDDYEKPEWDESFTWTFYRLQTIKGSVVLRWLGTSNGYYSESVSFAEV